MRVKICGLTRPADAESAARLGVDAIGLVFYPPSPRAVEIGQAREIASVLPSTVTRVALFVNPRPALVEQVLEEVPLDLLQFHGNESPAACRHYRFPYVKAAQVSIRLRLSALGTTFPDAFGLLLDACQPGVWGGSGQLADWSRIPRLPNTRVILAGGLRAENVAQAIRRTIPYAVDVSSGVEDAPGVKSTGKMSLFIKEVRNATYELSR